MLTKILAAKRAAANSVDAFAAAFRNQAAPPLAVTLITDSETGRQQRFDRISFSEERVTRGVFAPFHGRRGAVKGAAAPAIAPSRAR